MENKKRGIYQKLASWVCMFLLLVVSSEGKAAENLESVKQALDVIKTFADDFCNRIPLKGTEGGFQLSGNAKAELRGFLKKLADLGIEGTGKYELSEYEGILRPDLVEALRDNQKCRLQIWEDLRKLIPDLPGQPRQLSTAECGSLANLLRRGRGSLNRLVAERASDTTRAEAVGIQNETRKWLGQHLSSVYAEAFMAAEPSRQVPDRFPYRYGGLYQQMRGRLTYLSSIVNRICS